MLKFFPVTNDARGHATDVDARLAAITLLAQGESQADVARAVGVTREAVRKWRRLYTCGGVAALRRETRSRRRRTALSKMATLVERVAARPERFGLERRWTTLELTTVLERELGIRYTQGNVRKILVRLGYRFIAGVGFRRTSRPLRGRKKTAPWGYAFDAHGLLVRDEREQRVGCVVRLMHVCGYERLEILDVLREAHALAGVGERDGRPIGASRVFEIVHGGRVAALPRTAVARTPRRREDDETRRARADHRRALAAWLARRRPPSPKLAPPPESPRTRPRTGRRAAPTGRARRRG